MKDICAKAAATIHNDKETIEIKILKGMRQGDTISPKIFTAGLQEIFKRVEWFEDGVNVNGRKLNHLRFVDDIVIISNNTTNDLQTRLQELKNRSKIPGMKMNIDKTKVMFNKQIYAESIYIEDKELEKVE